MILFSKLSKVLFAYLDPMNIIIVMKMTNFRGDLSGMSDETRKSDSCRCAQISWRLSEV